MESQPPGPTDHFSFTLMYNVDEHIWTYTAFLQFLTAGISLSRPWSKEMFTYVCSPVSVGPLINLLFCFLTQRAGGEG